MDKDELISVNVQGIGVVRIPRSQSGELKNLVAKMREDPAAKQLVEGLNAFLGEFRAAAKAERAANKTVLKQQSTAINDAVKAMKALKIEIPNIQIPEITLPDIPSPEVPVTIDAPVITIAPQPVPEVIEMDNFKHDEHGRIKSCRQTVLSWKTE